jgi:hypothetical protein
MPNTANVRSFSGQNDNFRTQETERDVTATSLTFPCSLYDVVTMAEVKCQMLGRFVPRELKGICRKAAVLDIYPEEPRIATAEGRRQLTD